jgi:predicted nucleotidyltransferase
MIFKKHINYSIVDPVQPNLDSDIIIGDKLNNELRKKIISAIEIISNKTDLDIVKIWIIGSSLDYQYVKNESDIDITIFIERKTPEELIELNKAAADHLNEKLYHKGHPINFHFVKGRYLKFKADAIYDLLSDKWIKKPKAKNEDDIEDIIKSCSSLKEFNEVLEEYMELKNMLEGYSGNQEELEEIISQTVKVSILFDKIRDERRKDFNKKPDPNLPSANYRCSNIIYKLLEHYGLGDIVKEVTGFLESRLEN